jgi:hypothetical protein
MPSHAVGLTDVFAARAGAAASQSDASHPDDGAAQEHKASKIAERIDQRHNLGRQPAARVADGLIVSPPFAPVPCRWTLTMVPSIRAYSKSGSPDNSLNTLSNPSS